MFKNCDYLNAFYKFSVNLREFVNCGIRSWLLFQVVQEERAPGESWWKYMTKDLLRTAMILTTTQQKRYEFHSLRIVLNICTISVTGGVCSYSNTA